MTTTTTVYRAARFFTMEPDRPTAEAIAVRDGRIIGVGTLDEVTSPLEQFTLDDTPWPMARRTAASQWPQVMPVTVKVKGWLMRFSKFDRTR